jgi:hypothetical protein
VHPAAGRAHHARAHTRLRTPRTHPEESRAARLRAPAHLSGAADANADEEAVDGPSLVVARAETVTRSPSLPPSTAGFSLLPRPSRAELAMLAHARRPRSVRLRAHRQ